MHDQEDKEELAINTKCPTISVCWVMASLTSKYTITTISNSDFHKSVILTVHVLLMLVLDEGVAPGLGVLRRHHHPNALYCSVLLKLALQLTFAEKKKHLKVYRIR